MQSSKYTAFEQSNQEEACNPDQCESLTCLLDSIKDKVGNQDRVSVREVVDLVGKRWYGPLLILTGIIMMTPVIGDVPGVPVLMGLIVILISLQFLWKKHQVWLPSWISQQEVEGEKINRVIEWARGPSTVVDKVTHARLTFVVRPAGMAVISLMSILVASLTPILELIPFSAMLAGAAISAFGVSVLSKDGVIAVGAIAFSLVTAATATWFFI